MGAMEPSTASQSLVSEAVRADATATDRTEKPYGDSYHKPVIVRGRLKSPILPVWLSSRLSRLFKRPTPTH